MKLRALLLLCAATAGTIGASAQSGPPTRQRTPEERAVEQRRATELRTVAWRQADALAREIERRLEAGTATPEADARAAGARGEFGLMATVGRFGNASAPGVLCFTPGRQPARSVALFHFGDAIAEREARWFAYADAYNRVLIARTDYPDADLCRPAGAPNTDPTDRDERAATVAARPPARPPRTLHEAARRGTAADVRRLLGTGPIDAPDGVELSPLAWAVARNNGPAIEALLAAGADPWAGGQIGEGSAIFFAAVLGRGAWFARLAALPGRPFAAWPAWHQTAAYAGGDPQIMRLMLSEPHARLQIESLRRPFPSAAMLEPLLQEDPTRADMLLIRATEMETRPDLVRLALAHGASPNATRPASSGETALGVAARGIYPGSDEIVRLLLAAGADPNLLSQFRRPLWNAVGILKLDNRFDEVDARATANFHRLLAAGADINLPDAEGVSPIRALLFPYSREHRTLDASFVTPALLEMLVHAGLDLNARWHGDRVLSDVERQAGRNSELAVTLRRLGARR